MKQITVLLTSLILALLLISCSSDGDNIAGKSQRELSIGLTEGKVYLCAYEDGEPTGKFLSEIHTYDKDGNVATTSECDEEGNPVSKTVNKYNQAYMIIESILYDMNGNQEYTETMKYYPGDTIMAERIMERFDEKSNSIKVVEKYDDKGNTILMSSYSKGILEYEWIIENTYNDKNQLIRTSKVVKNATHTSEPDVREWIDENGNVLDAGTGLLPPQKKFNSNGQVIEEKQVGNDNVTKITYNKRGLMEEIIVYNNGKPTYGIFYEYK